MNAHTELLPRSTIAGICASRTASLARMAEAVDALTAAYKIAHEARALSTTAHGGTMFLGYDGDGERARKLLPDSFDGPAYLEGWRKELDRATWKHLMDSAGMNQLMDKQASDELHKSLMTDVIEATEENVRATLENLFQSRDEIFRRGLVNCFTNLDRRFRSHDGFKLGSRIIFTYAFDRDYGWISHGGTWRTITDIERVMAVLDGEAPDGAGLEWAVKNDRDRKVGNGPRQSETESRYFKIRGFKNGNAHLWFTRDDLVEKANKLLAEHYGEVLPDAYAEGKGDDLFRGTAVAKDLQFYRSPPAVVDEVISGLGLNGKRVLEPSAGDGSIALAAAAKGATVTAIEIAEDRVDLLTARAGRLSTGQVDVSRRNFLRVTPTPIYDFVLMNPPFFGCHWMDHVRHAFDFLAPGGILRAVLPASAEVNETPKHLAFRKWATPFYNYGWRGGFEDLPEDSFKDSGTRIQTVILHLRKK